MKIPIFIEHKLKENSELVGLVQNVLSRVSAHILANGMEFFPEYTDHSVTHVEAVLETAVGIIGKEALGQLTDEDAAVLAISVALHDLGMHLTRDGFESLVGPSSLWTGIPGLDKKNWNELWNEFYSEASRFDERKLHSLFGDAFKPVRPLPEKGEPWNDFDKLLVGEFIRRHHPRLAHEIAIVGMPGKDGYALEICSTAKSTKDLIEISGLVARSHGFPLRKFLDYLSDRFGQKICPRGAHAPFLMVLIRIADYLQIQSSRAPTERTDVHKLVSPISSKEWHLHQCVKEIHNTRDPETLEIVAEPNDVITFLKLREWLLGVQNELDLSWATLGEVYGLQYHNGKNRLGIEFRRVRSNVDDIEEFSRTVGYVPAKLSFESANADLLKLLVGPLYSNKAGIGIRELLQNAVDAVRELDDLISRGTHVEEDSRYKQIADVVLYVEVNEEKEPVQITITDRGTGMSLSILKDYFLKVGASYRSSDTWKKLHTDDSGTSRVLRTGRFGVGALAAFLLGDEIEVTTRHHSLAETDGLHLKAKIESDSIEVRRVSSPIGTSIKIALSKHASSSLKYAVPGLSVPLKDRKIEFRSEFGHYFLSRPSLARVFSNSPDPILVERMLPSGEGAEQWPWRRFNVERFGPVHWTYRSGWPSVSSNGIVINDNASVGRGTPRIDIESRALNPFNSFCWPNLSVSDPDALLPINLARTGLTSLNLGFNQELMIDIFDDIIADALLTCPGDCSGFWLDGQHPALKGSYWSYWESRMESHWRANQVGVMPGRLSFAESTGSTFLISAMGSIGEFDAWTHNKHYELPDHSSLRLFLSDAFDLNRIESKGVLTDSYRGSHTLKPIGAGVLMMPKGLLAQISGMNPGRMVRQILARFKSNASLSEWTLLGDPKSVNYQIAEKIARTFSQSLPSPKMLFRVEKSDQVYEPKRNPDPLYDRWMEILGQDYIPFGETDRKKLIEKASIVIGSKLALNRAEIDAAKAAQAAKSKKSDEEVTNDDDEFIDASKLIDRIATDSSHDRN